MHFNRKFPKLAMTLVWRPGGLRTGHAVSSSPAPVPQRTVRLDIAVRRSASVIGKWSCQSFEGRGQTLNTSSQFLHISFRQCPAALICARAGQYVTLGPVQPLCSHWLTRSNSVHIFRDVATWTSGDCRLCATSLSLRLPSHFPGLSVACPRQYQCPHEKTSKTDVEQSLSFPFH